MKSEKRKMQREVRGTQNEASGIQSEVECRSEVYRENFKIKIEASEGKSQTPNLTNSIQNEAHIIQNEVLEERCKLHSEICNVCSEAYKMPTEACKGKFKVQNQTFNVQCEARKTKNEASAGRFKIQNETSLCKLQGGSDVTRTEASDISKSNGDNTSQDSISEVNFEIQNVTLCSHCEGNVIKSQSEAMYCNIRSNNQTVTHIDTNKTQNEAHDQPNNAESKTLLYVDNCDVSNTQNMVPEQQNIQISGQKIAPKLEGLKLCDNDLSLDLYQYSEELGCLDEGENSSSDSDEVQWDKSGSGDYKMLNFDSLAAGDNTSDQVFNLDQFNENGTQKKMKNIRKKALNKFAGCPINVDECVVL